MKLPGTNQQLRLAITLLVIQCMVFTLYSLDAGNLKLRDYRPVSIYKVPQTKVEKAKYPVTDLHSHDFAETSKDVDKWVSIMNEIGIEKTVILSYETGAGFDKVVTKYARYKDRFEIWCGFDYTGMEEKDWSRRAVAEL